MVESVVSKEISLCVTVAVISASNQRVRRIRLSIAQRPLATRLCNQPTAAPRCTALHCRLVRPCPSMSSHPHIDVPPSPSDSGSPAATDGLDGSPSTTAATAPVAVSIAVAVPAAKPSSAFSPSAFLSSKYADAKSAVSAETEHWAAHVRARCAAPAADARSHRPRVIMDMSACSKHECHFVLSLSTLCSSLLLPAAVASAGQPGVCVAGLCLTVRQQGARRLVVPSQSAGGRGTESRQCRAARKAGNGGGGTAWSGRAAGRAVRRGARRAHGHFREAARRTIGAGRTACQRSALVRAGRGVSQAGRVGDAEGEAEEPRAGRVREHAHLHAGRPHPAHDTGGGHRSAHAAVRAGTHTRRNQGKLAGRERGNIPRVAGYDADVRAH